MRTPSFKTLASDSRFITLSESNKKLVPNKDVKFLIFNLPSKITCPFATENCKKFCYAVKAETAYPTCKPSRLKHLEESKADDFFERMVYTIESHLERPSYKNAKKVVVRIHESGDFYNVAYMLKWFEIANYFRFNKNVVFMAYTKSIGYYDLIMRGYGYRYANKPPKNMIVRFSVWDDTEPKQIDLAKKYNLPTCSAVEKFTKEIPSQNRCLCRDCAKCGKCWNNTKNIVCEIH